MDTKAGKIGLPTGSSVKLDRFVASSLYLRLLSNRLSARRTTLHWSNDVLFRLALSFLCAGACLWTILVRLKPCLTCVVRCLVFRSSCCLFVNLIDGDDHQR